MTIMICSSLVGGGTAGCIVKYNITHLKKPCLADYDAAEEVSLTVTACKGETGLAHTNVATSGLDGVALLQREF